MLDERDGATRALRRAQTVTVQLGSAPFAAHPDVLVHAPATFDPALPLRLVVFLHGWNGCLAVVAGPDRVPCTPGGPPRIAIDAVGGFDRAGADALLIVPQLAFDVPSSAPGRLGERGGLRALLAELLAHPRIAPLLGGPRRLADVERIALAAHSGAFVPAALALAGGGVDVHEIHLLDACYRDRPEFTAWVAAHRREFARGAGAASRRLTIVYTDREGTGPRSRALVESAARLLPDARTVPAGCQHATLAEPRPDVFAACPLLALRTATTHEDVPRVFLAPLLDTPEFAPRSPRRSP